MSRKRGRPPFCASSRSNLARQIAYVSERLQESPDVFDLRVHVSGPRARMFSLAQPQLFVAVEKL